MKDSLVVTERTFQRVTDALNAQTRIEQWVNAAARVLYECEKRRATHADSVIKAVAPNASDALLMEPWDECKDTFLADARALLDIPLPVASAWQGSDLHKFLAERFARHYQAWKGRSGTVEVTLSPNEIEIIAAALASSPLPVEGEREWLRKLVDVVWNHATESTAVPSTKTADMLIDRALSRKAST